MSFQMVYAITGPTAVGKSSISLEIAEKINASLISVDSRQIYKGLDIGTAKADSKDRSRASHLLLDELDPDESVSAGKYARRVVELTRSALENGPVIWIGGSTLYFHTLINGIANIPEIDEALRIKLNEEYLDDPHKLFNELQDADPKYAITLDPSKSQRLVRALEVYRQTGKTISYFHENTVKPDYPFEIRFFVLERSREELYERINLRVDEMLRQGLLAEVRGIMERNPSNESLPGLNSIGYKEVVKHLNGDIDHEEMVRLIKRNSRRYAKRQMTWFRKYRDIATFINLSSTSREEAKKLILS